MEKLTYAVTGVASGIGAELAHILTARGHRVIGFDIRETAENIDRFIPLDLNDSESIHEAAQAIGEPLDGLCNNAGLPPRDGLEETILQVNFLGTRALTHAIVPLLRKNASIVNMASRAGHGWRDGVEQVKRLGRLQRRDQLAQFIADEKLDATRCYNLTKEAVILWTVAETEAMVQRGFRINSLSPGGSPLEFSAISRERSAQRWRGTWNGQVARDDRSRSPRSPPSCSLRHPTGSRGPISQSMAGWARSIRPT